MERNIKSLISSMTLEEKAGLCSGASFWYTKPVERLGIPAVMMTDGPHGLRKQDGETDHLGMNRSVSAVCFPAACATSSSFDISLMEHLGDILGNECQAEDISILLGPAVNIKRSPLCGRNFEYFSEDPYLTGKMASAYIKGVQSHNVGTSIKHFAANNQEYHRMSASSEVSERALREIYLPGFEEAVKTAQPKTVMCSYNKINGVYSSENDWLLNKVLREDWGFEGYVVTDWGAVADRVEGIKAGLDLEMPSSNGWNDKKILEAVKNGTLDEAVLDKTVERLLTVLFSYVDNKEENTVFDRDKDHEEAVKMATECAVLLENNGVLPLNEKTKVVYIGGFAEAPRFQGGGSSHINASKVVSALEKAKEKGRSVKYVPGFSTTEDKLIGGIEEVVEEAKKADVAVIFAGLPDSFESEGYDRTHMRLPQCQNDLIRAVSEVQPNTVVVLHNGSPVECPWVDSVAAVLEMYLAGQGCGDATDQIIWGEANPSGRLAETFPMRIEDTPSYLNFPGDGKKVVYAEDIYCGYRWYDSRRIPVRWAFGHGLSYTSFEYSNLYLSSKDMGDEDIVSISVDVKNTGKVEGKEVVQLYISDDNGTPCRPVKELKGFHKVNLLPGEKKTVSMSITSRDLCYWNEDLKDWYAPCGKYSILVGHASDDIRVSGTINFTTKKRLPLVITSGTIVGDLLKDDRTAPIVKDMAARLNSAMANNIEESMSDMMIAMMEGFPLRGLITFGIMTPEELDMLINTFNSLLSN